MKVILIYIYRENGSIAPVGEIKSSLTVLAIHYYSALEGIMEKLPSPL
jgi:hypothetical protein